MGGSQQSVTDQTGYFNLSNVIPSNNFTLTLILQDGQRIQIPIGPVPAGATVQVNNIVVDKSQGSGTLSSVETENNDSADDTSQSEDGDSSPEDGDSTPGDGDSKGDGNSGPG